MQKKYDHLLFPILNEVGGTGRDLIKVVLGFVDRNTDFFKEKNATAKKTFQEMKLMKEETKNPPPSSTVKNEPIYEFEFSREDTQELFENNRKNVKTKEVQAKSEDLSCHDCQKSDANCNFPGDKINELLKNCSHAHSTMPPPPNSPQGGRNLDIVSPVQGTQYPTSPLSTRVRLLAKRKLFKESKLPGNKCKKTDEK